jgi:hypothetical protein
LQLEGGVKSIVVVTLNFFAPSLTLTLCLARLKATPAASLAFPLLLH